MSMELTKEDFDFVDAYCERNNINEGQGQKNLLYILIDAYKKEVVAQRYPKLLVQRATESVMQSIKNILDEEIPKIHQTINEKKNEYQPQDSRTFRKTGKFE